MLKSNEKLTKNDVSMDDIKERFKDDRFAEYAGIELLEVSKGYSRARMRIEEHHLNGLGTIHGGAIFTLADLAFAAAANSHGNVAVAINANISYMKALSSGIITAEAKEVSLNPKIATYTVHVTDEDGNIVAIFQGLAYRKKDMIVPAG